MDAFERRRTRAPKEQLKLSAEAHKLESRLVKIAQVVDLHSALGTWNRHEREFWSDLNPLIQAVGDLKELYQSGHDEEGRYLRPILIENGYRIEEDVYDNGGRPAHLLAEIEHADTPEKLKAAELKLEVLESQLETFEDKWGEIDKTRVHNFRDNIPGDMMPDSTIKEDVYNKAPYRDLMEYQQQLWHYHGWARLPKVDRFVRPLPTQAKGKDAA